MLAERRDEFADEIAGVMFGTGSETHDFLDVVVIWGHMGSGLNRCNDLMLLGITLPRWRQLIDVGSRLVDAKGLLECNLDRLRGMELVCGH